MTEPLKIGPGAVSDDRFDRQELISWWDQRRLSEAKVLVVGAGALGNEILKNLALVGVGSVLVVDMDAIEYSNLARSVLFRDSDVGGLKATIAAERTKQLYPAMRVQPIVGNIVHDVGLGAFRWADVTICGLDNREARVAVNRNCMLVGRPWIDGAIERLDGTMRVFLPHEGACYECTMSETDWQMLEARRSCALLTRGQMLGGRTPTTATSSSIVAGFQCQEALKLLHGLPVEGGKGVVINGMTNDIYPVTYPRKEDCYGHNTLGEIVELPESSNEITMAQLLDRARVALGGDPVLELSGEVLHSLRCAKCDKDEEVYMSLGKVTEADAVCPDCGEDRIPQLLHSVYGDDEFINRTPAELGLPPYDIIIARNNDREIGYLIAGDRDAVLGEVAG